MQSGQLTDKWSHLHLRGWPFQTVPDDTFAGIWADRTALKEDLDRMVWRWSRVDRSTLHLMWADLGAGKTHTLRHIRRRCLDSPELGILPVYVVMPRYMRTFVEVYQAILAALDADMLADMFVTMAGRAVARRTAARELFPSIPDAATALQTLALGSDVQRDLAAEWLLGTRLTRRQQDSIGVTRVIRTSDDAVTILSGLVRIVQAAGPYRRVVVMLDECQRLGNFKMSIGRDINTGLQTWFDASPNHLTLLMSFGSGEERYVRHLLSPELLNREDHQRLSLQLLSEGEALHFVGNLLETFRTEGCPSEHFPFTADTVAAVVRRLTGDKEVTPRLLMKAFDRLLEEADSALSAGRDFQLDAETAVKMVEEALAEKEPSQEE